MRGPKLTLEGVFGFIERWLKFKLSISHSSKDIKGVPNFTMERQISAQPSPSFGVEVDALLRIDRERSLIVCDGGDCRSEASF